jgi:hypothetical protein
MDQSELLRHVVGALEAAGIRYFITGSVASTAYGESRFTNDIDIVADVSLATLADFLRAFPEQDFYVSPEAAAEAVRTHDQFNIIQPESGLKIDVIIAKPSGLDRVRLDRARRHPVEPGFEPMFSSPEDLILKKMDFYREGGSEKHLRDITGILKSGNVPVDRAYIAGWAEKLGLSDLWNLIVQRLDSKSA